MSNDWTRFRGANGAGAASPSGVAADFKPGDIKWKAELPGDGHSSPVLAGGRVFLTAAQREKGQRHLVGLDAASGKEMWRASFPYTPYVTHQLNTAASATCAVDDNRVYSLWSETERFVAMAHTHSGKEVWKRDLGAFPTQHGGASSPIVFGDSLIFSREPENAPGALMALDSATGKTRWEISRPSRDAPYSVPMLFSPEPGAPTQAIFSSTAHGLTAVDAKTGAIAWELRDLFRFRCVASPILAGGLIVATSGVGSGDRMLVAVRPPKNGARAEVVWKMVRGAPYVPTPVASGPNLFLWGDNGIVTCVKASSGETIWQERVGGNFYGSPVLSEGKLWAMGARGELVVIAADTTFKILARHELGEASNATPAFGPKTLYLRTVGHLIAVAGR